MRVEVTDDHLRRGVSHCANLCPVALGLNDASPGQPWSIYPDGSGWWACRGIFGRVFRLPPEAEELARAFDKGLPVGPMEFELDLEGVRV